MLIDEGIVENNIFNFATNDLSQYTIHTAYLKTDWFNDNDGLQYNRLKQIQGLMER